MRWFFRRRCRVVYRSEYIASVHAQDSHRAFDVMKFKKIRDQLIADKLMKHGDFLKGERASDEEILLVHEKKYLETLKSPMHVGQLLMLDYINPWDDYVFEYFRYITGGTILAVEYTLDHNIPVFNLGGGYHHAQPARAEGFCLINDIAIAIEKARKTKSIRKVLVVDLDYHQGNGTLMIYQNDPDVFTFSIHAATWEAIEKENNLDIELPLHVSDAEYLTALQDAFPAVFSSFQPELVIYVAGSDPYIKDALGEFDLTEEGMLKRDQFVFNEVRHRKLPLAIVAGGGYGKESWKIYYNFIRWVLEKGY
ncbi:MAG: histone deacetylase [Calditrichaeota bacterium]|nr:MAG: histone deacetylase [Calditrichota bacterium]